MKTSEDIKKLFGSLTASEQSLLLDELLQGHELSGTILTSAFDDVVNKRLKKPCPYCKSEKVYKRGKQKGVQMYRCNDCNKWYSETTGTPLYDIKLKSKWQAYLRCMEQGLSIKNIAKELEISIQTSFDWRHKILSSLNQFTPEHLSGEVECDELELALSNKGEKHLERKPRKRGSDFKRNQGKEDVTVVQVVTAVERNGEKYLKAVASKRLSKEEITIALEGKLEEGVTLITDKHPSYKSFAKDNPSINHRALLAKEHVDKKDGKVNLQKVNNTHAQLRKFLMTFNGVSTKYLQNYLNWFAYADKLRQTKTTLKQWFIAALLSDQAYELFWLFKQNAVVIRT
jgi:transposase-like protein